MFKKKEAILEKEGERFKARLVANGYSQRHEINYDEVFSLVVRHISIRVVLALATHQDLELEQMDVRTAFLHGNLEKEISWYNQRGSSNLVQWILSADWRSHFTGSSNLLDNGTKGLISMWSKLVIPVVNMIVAYMFVYLEMVLIFFAIVCGWYINCC